jgi:predicted PurR-regulated permease PerM
MATYTLSSVTETPVSASQSSRMPRWVPRAVVIFWLGFIGTLVLRFTFHRLNNFLILMLVSLFIALALEPAVNRLVARGRGRRSSTGLLMLGLVVIVFTFVGAVGTIVGQQVADVLSNSEQYVNDTVKILNDTFSTQIDAASVNEKISDPNGPVQEFVNSQQDKVFNLSVQALGVIFQMFTVLLFSYYLVADGPRLRRSICSRLRPDRQRQVLNAWELAITKTGGYLYSRALLAVISSFFHWIAFQAIGIPAPIAMALWVGFVSQFLPVIGTYIAGVLPLVLTFVESPIKALVVVGFIAVYQQVENYLFAPKVTARTLELHPALAFGGALVGGAVLGPVGAILALPAVAMGQALVSSWGTRHEVIDDPLTLMPPEKPVRAKRSSRKNRSA